MELPKRKAIRLPGFDYSAAGYYFITICTRGKQKLLCSIVGTGLPDGPNVQLTRKGTIAKKQLDLMADFYKDIRLDKYVVMPNHIHLLLQITDCDNGPSGRPVPTNTKVSQFVGTFKRFCNREIGENIWQYRSYDHVIRGEKDYLKIWNYIDGNPSKWLEDCYYMD